MVAPPLSRAPRLPLRRPRRGWGRDHAPDRAGVLFSGTRQVLFGLAAAGLTFGLGCLIGVSLAG